MRQFTIHKTLESFVTVEVPDGLSDEAVVNSLDEGSDIVQEVEEQIVGITYSIVSESDT